MLGSVNSRFIFAVLLIMIGSVAAFGAPATLTQSVSDGVETITLRMTLESIRGPQFEVLVQNSSGTYDTHTAADVATYIGTVDEYPGAIAAGILKSDGDLWAKVYFDRGYTWYTLADAKTGERGGGEPTLAFPTRANLVGGIIGTTTYEYDLAIDCDWRYYNGYAGSSAATCLEQVEFSVVQLKAIYLKDALLVPVLARVIVRGSQTYCPYDGTTGTEILPLVQSEWQNNQSTAVREIVACVTPDIGGGVAWLGTINNTSNGYSVNGIDADGSFDVVARHEIGHNWSVYDLHAGSPEGPTVNCGNAYGRFAGPSVKAIMTERDAEISSLTSIGTYSTIDVPPYACLDDVIIVANSGTSTTIDVLENDHDANNDSISLSGYDSVSAKGATISLSSGTGPGGRDELIYTPGNGIALDSFYYTVVDSSGSPATGAVVVYLTLENTLQSYWNLDETSGTSAQDASVFANTANAVGGLDFGVSSVAGKFGTAIQLDGVDDHLQAPALNLNSNTVTITGWIKRNGDQNSYSGIAMSGITSGMNFINATNLGYHWAGSTVWQWNSGLTVPNDQWTFVALAVEPTKAVYYMNPGTGMQSATNTTTHAVDEFSNIFRLGSCDGWSGRYFNGAIDDFRVYDKTLSSTEIQAVYDGGGAESPSPFDGAEDITSSLLRWAPGADVTSSNVYVGTSATAVANATTASAEYKGSVAVPGYLADLNASTTYYWRVDTVTSSTTLTGDVWELTTAATIDDINTGIVSHLTMDDADISGTTISDASGTPTYDGTIVGATTGATGQISEALTFDGVNDKVTIPATNLNSNTITISAWLKRSGDQPAYGGIVIAASGASTTKSGLNFVSGNNLGYHWNGGFWSWNSGLTVPDNQWSHVAMVVEPTKTTLYLNGVSATSSGTHVADEFDCVFDIGTYDNWSSRMYTGDIDDVAVWDASLTENQILSIYYAGLQGRTFDDATVPADTTAPTPDPMTFATAPYATGTTSISMTATTASDPSGVEYFFDCTAGGGNNSGWQDSTTYEDTGLSPGTQYTYTVTARDKSANQNTTAASSGASATTDTPADTTPPTPDPMTFATAPYATGTTTISMTATTATDLSGVEYFFDCTAGGGNDSGWQDSTTYEDTGLTPDTQYTYTVTARDKSVNLNATSASAALSATTDPTASDPDMYVNDISMGYRRGGRSYYGQATVWIKDDGGANIAGATVYGNWSGSVSGADSGVTLTDGTVMIESPRVKNGGTFTFTVTSVVKAGYVYNSALNVETSDSITAP